MCRDCVIVNDIYADTTISLKNVWGDKRACCSKIKRDSERICNCLDVICKKDTKNPIIPSDPLPLGQL